MVRLSSCPLCNSSGFKPYLKCTDHFLTSETFTIVRCESCGFLVTNPRPAKDEITRYYKSESYISHSDSDKGITNRIYQMIRKKTLDQKAGWIAKYKKQGRLLDIGAGTGHFLDSMKNRGFSVYGVEPEKHAREVAMKNFGLELYPDLEERPSDMAGFDIITLWHVLEHVHDLNPTLEKIKSLLNKNGILIVAVPNPESYDAKYYGEYWAAWDLPRHLYHFTQSTISRCLENHQFELKKTHPMKFDSYYVSLLSEKYQSGKSNYIKSVFRGFLSNFHAQRNEQNYSSLTYFFTIKN